MEPDYLPDQPLILVLFSLVILSEEWFFINVNGNNIRALQHSRRYETFK